MFNPHKRISAKEALNHAYFRDDLDTSRTSSSPSMSSPSMSESDSTDGRSDTPVSKWPWKVELKVSGSKVKAVVCKLHRVGAKWWNFIDDTPVSKWPWKVKVKVSGSKVKAVVYKLHRVGAKRWNFIDDKYEKKSIFSCAHHVLLLVMSHDVSHDVSHDSHLLVILNTSCAWG